MLPVKGFVFLSEWTIISPFDRIVGSSMRPAQSVIPCALALVLLMGSALSAACGNESAPATPKKPTTAEPGKDSTSQESSGEEVPVYTYRVVRTYPHDRRAFTQGLVFADGILYESTGGSRWSPALLGQSTLRKVEMETGKVLEMKLLSPDFFGEGITLFADRIIQLTWRARVGFVYDKSNLARLEQFTYSTEGWGITNDGKRLIMSDGTEVLYFWNPETFAEVGRLVVTANGLPVTWLNELEYVRGEIFANVWQSDRLARISPETGAVSAWVDLAGLLSSAERGPGVDVLNGIAYDAERDRLLVTGKGWPKLFEIELIPPQ
jgi:glutamine cyclotransferase